MQRVPVPLLIRIFRIAAITEAITWLGLLASMYEKYIADTRIGRAADLRDAARVCVPGLRARRVPRARGVQVDAPDDGARPRRVGPAARDRAVRALGIPPLPRALGPSPRSGSSARREAPIPRHRPRWGVDEGGRVFSKRIRVSPGDGRGARRARIRRQRHVARAGRRDEDRQAHQRVARSSAARFRATAWSRAASRATGSRRNSITGKQINEKTLATVPSAAQRRPASRSRTERPMRSAPPMPTTRSRSAARLPPATSASPARTIPSGTTVTGAFGIGANVTAAVTVAIVPPTLRPGTPTAATAAPRSRATSGRSCSCRARRPPTSATPRSTSRTPGTVDVDPSCTGTPHAPTAPAGKVCLYLVEQSGSRHGRRRPGDPRARGKPRRIRRARHQRGARRDRRVRHLGVHRPVI